MAYFPNGTAGMIFEEQHCSRCVHRNGPDGKSGCAVWLVHLLFSYELCNSECAGKQMLDTLIPEDKDGFPGECAMFHEGKAVPDPTEIEEQKKNPLNAPNVPMPAMREWAKQHGIPQP